MIGSGTVAMVLELMEAEFVLRGTREIVFVASVFRADCAFVLALQPTIAAANNAITIVWTPILITAASNVRFPPETGGGMHFEWDN